MNQREYDKLKKQFKEEYERKLSALELIYKESNVNDNSNENPKKSRVKVTLEPKQKMPGLKDTVRRVIPDIKKDFSLHDVEDKLTEMDPEAAINIKKASLSSVLKRLESEGYIAVVERGFGKRPSIYSLVSHGMAAEEQVL